MSGPATVKIISVIETTHIRGEGKAPDDPMRQVTQYWDSAGKFLAEDDPTPSLRFEALVAAGDQLAHNLTYEQNAPALSAWWEARGGHEVCTVCRSQKPPAHRREDSLNDFNAPPRGSSFPYT